MLSEEKEPKSLIGEIMDKSIAIYLRLSAFICGLNKYNNIIFVHLLLIKLDIQTYFHLIFILNILQDRVPTNA
ncbi:MAG: hypothetical protein KKA10_09215 [Euryarchaeota archaeon]|nr:hypothetical protein [Euryarchaeota archaeon]